MMRSTNPSREVKSGEQVVQVERADLDPHPIPYIADLRNGTPAIVA